MVREGFNISNGNFPLKGHPSPRPGASTDEIFPKSWGKFLDRKGGDPPPPLVGEFVAEKLSPHTP